MGKIKTAFLGIAVLSTLAAALPAHADGRGGHGWDKRHHRHWHGPYGYAHGYRPAPVILQPAPVFYPRPYVYAPQPPIVVVRPPVRVVAPPPRWEPGVRVDIGIGF